MKTVYLGHNPGYAAACHDESELLAVCWHGGIGGNLANRTDQMLAYCESHKIPTLRHFRSDGILPALLTALAPDLVVVGEYHYMVKEPILSIPPLGVINLHGAPLPRYRGAHPINWMIINGETSGAVTCHYVTPGLDAGGIIAQYGFPILDTDTAFDVRPRIEETGRRVLTDTLRRFRQSGQKLPGTPQDESMALYTPPRRPEDGLIDWNQSAKRVYDFVRALTRPYPGAFAQLGDSRIVLWTVAPPQAVMPETPALPPGTVIDAAPGHLEVAVVDGTVIISDWECDGRSIIPGDQLIGQPTTAIV